jgi:hypothetical protein
MKDLDESLRGMFVHHCASTTSGMDSAGFLKFVDEIGLPNQKQAQKQAGTIFQSVRVGRKDTINYDRFQEAIRRLAVKMDITYQEVVLSSQRSSADRQKTLSARFSEDEHRRNNENRIVRASVLAFEEGKTDKTEDTLYCVTAGTTKYSWTIKKTREEFEHFRRSTKQELAGVMFPDDGLKPEKTRMALHGFMTAAVDR